MRRNEHLNLRIVNCCIRAFLYLQARKIVDMRKILVFPVISFLFLLGSCIPGKMLTYEALTPAEYTFTPETKGVLVFNSSYIPAVDTSSFNILSRLADPEEQFIVDTLIINNIFNGFFYIIDQSPVSAFQNVKYAELRSKDTTAFLSPLSNESISYLLREFDADMLISLEYYGMNYNTRNWYSDFADFRAYLELNRILLWRIYDSTGLQKEKMIRDTISWLESGATLDEAKNALPRLLDAIREAFWFAGEEFARELSPSWRETERSYYLLNDGASDRSLDPLYLREIIEDNRGIKSYKAHFNMAIYYEKEGNPSLSLFYMDEALKMRPGAVLPKFYRKQLVEKVSEFEKLKEQLQ